MKNQQIKKFLSLLSLVLGLAITSYQVARADLLDPDCTAEKAAKSAAAQAAIGIGGRCSPAEAVKDTAKRTMGIEDKGSVEKLKNDTDGITKSAIKKVTK